MSTPLPESLYTAAQVRELDRITIDRHAVPGIVLMQRAAAAAFQRLRAHWPHARRVAVACGNGNNAGDGFIIARLAHEAGCVVRVIFLGDEARLRGDARAAFEAMTGAGVEPVPGGDLPGDCDVIVDALLGTGLDREVTGRWAEAIERVNDSGVPVLAVDIPSGLHADTGQPLGVAIRADLTVTFIGLKQGLFTGRARDHRGLVEFAGLGVPAAVYHAVPCSARRESYDGCRAALGPRPRSAHKGDSGHVLVVGGDAGFAGAARLAAEAAARAGAGLTSVATRAAHAPVLGATRPELMVRGVEGDRELAPLLERANVTAIGPGLGQGDWGLGLLEAALAFDGPLVVDADGLNLIARHGLAGVVRERRAPTVLTPHPGEAGRLLGCTTGVVERDRFAAVREIASAFGAVALLKGAGTLVHAPGGPVHACEGGNPGMATGGIGDVLTGIVAALLAQGLPAERAALVGALVHAAAGDRAARGGERGMLAGDLLGELRWLVNPADGSS